MRRTFMQTAALTVAFIATSVTAQNAIRCEVDGKVVYGDAACATGSTTRAIAPTQETAEQKAAGKAANDQIRKDTAYVDKRLDDRYKRDSTRPAVASNSKTVADANTELKRGGPKAKQMKKASKKAKQKAAKRNNSSNRPAPKA